MQQVEKLALDFVCFVFDSFFFLYPTPLIRSGANIQVEARAWNCAQTCALWCVQFIASLHKLLSFVYRCTTAEISGYFFFHLVVLIHTTVGFLCGVFFRIKYDETFTYFCYLNSLTENFKGRPKKFHFLKLSHSESEF